jgi:transcription elongation factor Elf1
VLTSAVRAAPHLPQKFEDGAFSALYFRQRRGRAFPQRAQKLLPAGFSAPHFEQRISCPPPPFEGAVTGLDSILDGDRFLCMVTFQEFMVTFPDETACRQFLQDRRWPDGVRCPRCGNEKVYALKEAFKWQCQSATCGKRGYRFSVLVGTVFENTNVPIVTWFKVLYTTLQSKKGISSRQIRRMFFGETSSLHTAWYVCHRLRAGMRDGDFKQLMGIVEVDETGIGGSDRNRHANKKQHITGLSGKTTVIGAISRKGNCDLPDHRKYRR